MVFGWEVLPHPLYSPDLAPTDYHLLHALKNSFSQKIFEGHDTVKTAIQDTPTFCEGMASANQIVVSRAIVPSADRLRMSPFQQNCSAHFNFIF
ncbi:hypothetical protein TNCV_488981 [Trichonephila clavipes]|nr:hypothetical protein TNCV_488981 [Trichonephila clavipes]